MKTEIMDDSQDLFNEWDERPPWVSLNTFLKNHPSLNEKISYDEYNERTKLSSFSDSEISDALNSYKELIRKRDTRIYFAREDGRLVDNLEISRIASIVDDEDIAFYDLDSIREYASKCIGLKKEVKNPSVRYLIKREFKFQAIKLFHYRHPELTLTRVKDIIERMEDDLKKKNANKIGG